MAICTFKTIKTMTELTVTQGDNAHPTEDLMHLLAQAEQRVRAQPTHPEHRWAMVEILCTLCQWDRALAQLQAWAKFVPDGAARAHLTRGLIQAEAQRVQVFLGQQPPGVVVDYPPWMVQLAQALAYNAQGLHHKADDCRQQAQCSRIKLWQLPRNASCPTRLQTCHRRIIGSGCGHGHD
jgi:protein involved in temperature-dependent protein secretion